MFPLVQAQYHETPPRRMASNSVGSGGRSVRSHDTFESGHDCGVDGESRPKTADNATKDGWIHRLKKSVSSMAISSAHIGTAAEGAPPPPPENPHWLRPDLNSPDGSQLPLGNHVTIEGPLSRSSAESTASSASKQVRIRALSSPLPWRQRRQQRRQQQQHQQKTKNSSNKLPMVGVSVQNFGTEVQHNDDLASSSLAAEAVYTGQTPHGQHRNNRVNNYSRPTLHHKLSRNQVRRPADENMVTPPETPSEDLGTIEQATTPSRLGFLRKFSSSDLRRNNAPSTPTPHTAPMQPTPPFSPSPIVTNSPKEPRAATHADRADDSMTSLLLEEFSPTNRASGSIPVKRDVSISTIKSGCGYTYARSQPAMTALKPIPEQETHYVSRTKSQVSRSVQASAAKARQAQARLERNKNPFTDRKRQKELAAALYELGAEFYRRSSVTGAPVQRDTVMQGQERELIRLMTTSGLEFDDVELAIKEWYDQYVRKRAQEEEDGEKKAARRAFVNKCIEIVRTATPGVRKSPISPAPPSSPPSPSVFDREALYGQFWNLSTLSGLSSSNQANAANVGLGIEKTTPVATGLFKPQSKYSRPAALPEGPKLRPHRIWTKLPTLEEDPFHTETPSKPMLKLKPSPKPKPKPESIFFPNGHAELNAYLDNDQYAFTPRKSTIGMPVSDDGESVYSLNSSASGSTVVLSGNQVGAGERLQSHTAHGDDEHGPPRKDSVFSELSASSSTPPPDPAAYEEAEEDKKNENDPKDGEPIPDFESDDNLTPTVSPEPPPDHVHDNNDNDDNDNEPDFDAAISAWAATTFPSLASPREDHPYVLPPLNFSRRISGLWNRRPDSWTVPPPLRIPSRGGTAPAAMGNGGEVVGVAVGERGQRSVRTEHQNSHPGERGVAE